MIGALGQFAIGQATDAASNSLAPSLFTNTNTFYAPTVIQEQFLTAPLVIQARLL